MLSTQSIFNNNVQGCPEQQGGGINIFKALMKSLCALSDTLTHTGEAFTNELWFDGTWIREIQEQDGRWKDEAAREEKQQEAEERRSDEER